MRSFTAVSLAALAALLQPLAVDAAIHIIAYADAPFTVDLPYGTKQLYPPGSTWEINSDADVHTWTAYNGAKCHLELPIGVPTDTVVGFEMINGPQYLYPCGEIEGVRVVCVDKESLCTMAQ